MSVVALLSELRSRDIEVRADGEQLRCAAGAGALTPGLRDELVRRKGEVLEFLRAAQAAASRPAAIVPLQGAGERVPVFAVPGHNGDVFCYRALARCLGNQPFYGLQPPGLMGEAAPLASVEEIARYFAAQIRAFQPAGPCILAGFCAGGAVAFELAQMLAREGRPVAFVALFGAPYPAFFRPWMQRTERIAKRLRSIGKHARAMAGMSWRERCAYVHAKGRRRGATDAAPAPADPIIERRRNVEEATLAAVRAYRPRKFDGKLCLMLPSRRWARGLFFARRWAPLARECEEHVGPDGATGDDMLLAGNAPVFAELFRRAYATNIA
jgi:thioesterase domain-containing protein